MCEVYIHHYKHYNITTLRKIHLTPQQSDNKKKKNQSLETKKKKQKLSKKKSEPIMDFPVLQGRLKNLNIESEIRVESRPYTLYASVMTRNSPNDNKERNPNDSR